MKRLLSCLDQRKGERRGQLLYFSEGDRPAARKPSPSRLEREGEERKDGPDASESDARSAAREERNNIA